jgi:AcrR family transcriptional regulator
MPAIPFVYTDTMSELTGQRPLRADAQRSRAAILESASTLLCEQPDASLEDVAGAAGVSRQTVYSHFGSRRDLLAAVAGRATDEYLTALDAARLQERPAGEALIRFVEISTDSSHTIHRLPPTVMSTLADSDAAHAPVRERIIELVRRGQRSGDFARGLSAEWLAAATIALGHAVGSEVAEGRLSLRSGQRAFRESLGRLYGTEV